MSEKVYKSTKSNSRFVVRGEPNRAYLVAEGEAATNSKVLKECERVRREGGTFATVEWIARQLSRTY